MRGPARPLETVRIHVLLCLQKKSLRVGPVHEPDRRTIRTDADMVGSSHVDRVTEMMHERNVGVVTSMKEERHRHDPNDAAPVRDGPDHRVRRSTRVVVHRPTRRVRNERRLLARRECSEGRFFVQMREIDDDANLLHLADEQPPVVSESSVPEEAAPVVVLLLVGDLHGPKTKLPHGLQLLGHLPLVRGHPSRVLQVGEHPDRIIPPPKQVLGRTHQPEGAMLIQPPERLHGVVHGDRSMLPRPSDRGIHEGDTPLEEVVDEVSLPFRRQLPRQIHVAEERHRVVHEPISEIH